MMQQFQGFLKHRRITLKEKLGFDNVHIFKPSPSSQFVNLLKLGLDNLYMERLLESGTCTVCCEATSKFCSNCGTNYCSVNCQTRDWERHHLVCENTSLVTRSTASTSSINCNDNDNENISHTNVIPAQQPEENDVSQLEDSLKDSAKIKPNDGKTKLSKELHPSKTVNTANEKDDCSKDLSFQNICQETESNIVSSKKRKRNKLSNQSMKSAGSESEIFQKPAKYERFKIGQSYKIKFLTWVEKSVMCYVIPVELQNMLHNLKTKLQSSYHNYECVKNVAVGETYLAFVNKEWCRVKVKNSYPNMKNDSKKVNARKIDMGGYCSPAVEEMRELPPEIRTLKPLATMVKFVAHINAFDECSVNVIGFEKNGVPLVAFKKESESSTESIMSTENSGKRVEHMSSKCPSIEEINCNKSKTAQSKESTDEIWKKEKLEHQNYRRSIVSELKDNTVGYFRCVKKDNHLMYGYLVPANNETATDSMTRKSNLDDLPLVEITARPGDLVMVQQDSGRYSGRVEKKAWGRYSVYLFDCNYSVNTKKVYELDKSCYNTIDLGCHIILDRETIIKHQLTVNEKKYPIYVTNKESADSRCCKIRIMNFDVSGTIMGAQTPCECFIPMESGCSVIITSVGEVRNVGDGAEIKLYVQLASKKWQSFFQEYNNSFRKTMSHECDSSFRKGELVFARSSNWHRAEVLDFSKKQIKVRFVDIGDEKLLHLNAIRKMSEQYKNMPFFSRLIRVRLGKNFTEEVDCFKAFMEKKTTLTMTYDSNMGMDVKLSIPASSETEIESCVSDNGNDSRRSEKKEIDKRDMSLEINLSRLSVGPIPNFTVLHVDEEEFESEGVFWGTKVDSKHFKYVADDLGKEITQYCKSSKDTEYHPEIGEFCLAVYEDEWYRGLVVNKFDQRFEVFFIDFGNKSLVGPKKIRRKNSSFFSHEPLAARCVLSGFSSMTAKERESALEYLNLKMNERLSVYVENVINNVNCIRIPELKWWVSCHNSKDSQHSKSVHEEG